MKGHSDEPKPSAPGVRNARVQKLFRPASTKASTAMTAWRVRLHDIIFEADTKAGKAFDVALLWAIMLSVLAVMLESVASIEARWGLWLKVIEWTVTVLFSVEYLLRLACVRKPLGYAKSFFGVVDLLSVIPTYLGLFFAGAQALAVVRVLRILRVFRLFKLSQFVDEAEALVTSLAASFRKIIVFMGAVLTIVVIMGTCMYLIEGAKSGFDSIPRAIYWAIVTLTTVGYGDIAPDTPLGQTVAAFVMMLGYVILAVPTGIVSVELARTNRKMTTRSCPDCVAQDHDHDAVFCKVCGAELEFEPELGAHGDDGKTG